MALDEKYLQGYANSNRTEFFPDVGENLAKNGFLWVDISGAMKLTDMKHLPQKYLDETLIQSLKREVEPFNNETSKNFLAVINRKKHEISLKNILKVFNIVDNPDFIETMPIYFQARCSSLAVKLKIMMDTLAFEEGISSNYLDLRDTTKTEIVQDLLEIKNECDSFKARWEIISSIQEIINKGKKTLEIPVDYPYQLPAYLGLLSNSDGITVKILNTNSTSIDNENNIKANLIKFCLEGRIAGNAVTSANREIETQSFSGVWSASRQTSARQLQSLPQEQLTTTEDEPEEMSHIEVITANQQQFTLPVHNPRRD